jgi:hypothetical protein
MKAFPTNVTKSSGGDGWKTDYGMDLRDYFAAHAMQAIISNSDKFSTHIEEIDNWVGDYSYKVADAMMEARNDNK